jgi:LmbE family N-acetylglucosaminyl deacetylase
MRLVLACAVFAACGDNALGPPLVPSGDVVVVAHQDDDLLFMQPDLGERVTAHEPTTIVYVTAGDAGGGLVYATARIGASKAAYSVVAGASDWNCGWIELDGHDAEHCRLDGANLSLVFLGYPDGGITGATPTSLLNLWEGNVTRVETVAEFRATYERGDLIATIGAILDATQPATIRTLEIAATHGSDHSDHMLVGTLTLLAALHTGSTAQVLSYRGYDTNYEPPTVTDDGMYALTSLPMRAYEACALVCDGDCGVTPCSTLSDPRYVGFTHRRYAVSNRTTPQSGILSSPSGCLVEAAAAPGGVAAREANQARALGLGSCDDAVTVELAPGGLAAIDGGCLQVQPDGSLAIGTCELSADRAFALDDEGHLWSGLPADPQPGMDVMHTTCIAGDDHGAHLALCGANNDARWDLVRTATITPRRVSGSTNNVGRAIRIGDMTGDGLADMCTATPKGLVCGVGDGTGGFGAPVQVGPASFQIQPQSLALGDVDGDGLPDACGRTSAGIVCATSSTDYQPEAWSTEFAASGSASASDRSLAIIQGSVCGASADGVVCVNGEVESILTSWPGTAGAPVWPADLDGDTDPDWCSATPEGVQCGLAAEQAITESGQSWGFSIDAVVQGSVASDGTLDDTVHSAIADVSGDGRGDMCVAIGDRVECAVGQGHGFGPRHLALVMPTHKPIIGLWLGDLDGDGKADPCADDGGVIACSLSP